MKQTQLDLYGVDADLRLFTSNPLKKSILEYLGNHPRAMLVCGPERAPELCLDLGKLLVWIAHRVDDNHGPNFHASVELDEMATNVRALGEQFQEVGRKLMAGSPARVEARVIYLQQRLADLETRYVGMFESEPRRVHEVNTPEWMRSKPRNHTAELQLYRGGVR